MTDSSFLSFITASPGDRKTSLLMVVAEKQDEMFRVLGKMPSEVRNKALGCWYDLREYIDSEVDSPEIKTIQTQTAIQTDQCVQTETDCCSLKEASICFIDKIRSTS